MANAYYECHWASIQELLHPKKVGTLPPAGDDVVKRTNEITTAIPLLDAIEIHGKTITADALLTQRGLAEYLVETRKAHYHFTAKGNQPTLLDDIKVFFNDRQEPDYVTIDPPDHGRIETRKIWITTLLNEYLNFPHVGQAFVIERERINKKTGKSSKELAYRDHKTNPHSKLTPNRFSPLIAAIGLLRIAVTTSSTGTTMKIAAESVQDTAQRT